MLNYVLIAFLNIWLIHIACAYTHDLNGLRKEPCLCSFYYFTKESFYESSDDLFSYCNDFKYYFCRNKTSNVIEVLNNTWEYATKCGTFSRYELKRIVRPGYYWKRKTAECGSDGLATNSSWNDWHTQKILCGAYSKEAGRHFRPCNTSHNHIHVCVSSDASLRQDLYNDSCFLETDSVANVSHTQSSDMSSTIRNARGPANENAEEDTEAEAETIAGIVVGVCLAALADTDAFLVKIQRRMPCRTQTTVPTTSGKIRKPIHCLTTLVTTLGMKIKKQNNTEQSKRKNTEISNDALPSINQHRTAEEEEPYYNQTKSTHVTNLTDQQTTEASSYSCAVETENNVRENEMSLDEYDTTISTRNEVYKTENVYNKFEPANNSSDVYDSTLPKGKSFETDEVYNELSRNAEYGQFGTTLSNNEDYDSF